MKICQSVNCGCKRLHQSVHSSDIGQDGRWASVCAFRLCTDTRQERSPPCRSCLWVLCGWFVDLAESLYIIMFLWQKIYASVISSRAVHFRLFGTVVPATFASWVAKPATPLTHPRSLALIPSASSLVDQIAYISLLSSSFLFRLQHSTFPT
jgi:hypothetical protein